MSTNTAVPGHADHAHGDWPGAVTCCLPSHIHTHVSLYSRLGSVASCVLIHMQAFLYGKCPRRTLWHIYNAYQRQPNTRIYHVSKVPEQQTVGARKSITGSYSCMPDLSATLPSQSAAWDKILGWTDLWSEPAQPFSCPNALLTASYVPCSLIHFDKDLF